MKSAKILGVIVAASLSGLAGIEIQLPDSSYAIGIAQAVPVIDPKVSVVNQPQNLPMKGNPDAIVTIVEFSDYQCPFCSRVEPTIKQLLEDYPDKIRVVFAHLPLAFHTNALPAAKAAHAAYLQGKFWEMHDALFENQRSLSDDFYIETARQLELNIEKFKSDMESPSTDSYIEKCISDANAVGLKGTPSFLINGVQFVGAQPIDKFRAAIDEEIIRAEKTAKSKKLSGEKLYAELVKTAPAPAPKESKSVDDEDNATRKYVNDGRSAVIGNNKALVTIVAYIDLQCPFTKRAWDTLHELMRKNPKKFRVVFKHNPLPFHNDAKLAARAAEAAKKQKKFEQYAQKLFDNQSALDRDSLIKYAKELKLNEKKFIEEMDGPETLGQVTIDLESASDAGVKGTPHFLFNGVSFSGAQPLESFQAALDRELQIAQKYSKANKNISGQKLYEKLVKDNPVPEKPPIVVNTNGAPTLGPDDAPVTIIEFSDFECPFCSRAHNTIKELMELDEYRGKIKLVFMQNPLPFHSNAKIAAQASLFAHNNGKFWEMHDILFENRNSLDKDSLLSYAAEIGLDRNALAEILDSDMYLDIIENHQKEATKAGISGTPSFVINGELFVGAQPLEKFRSMVDKALEKAKKQNNKKTDKNKK